MKRILVTGSRDWTDVDLVREALLAYAVQDACVLRHGDARGLDRIAAGVAHELGWTVETYAADWGRLGRQAGHVRNQQMVDAGADVCLAFPLPGSRGTYDCAARAIRADIPVEWVPKLVPETRRHEEIELGLAFAWRRL